LLHSPAEMSDLHQLANRAQVVRHVRELCQHSKYHYRIAPIGVLLEQRRKKSYSKRTSFFDTLPFCVVNDLLGPA
jgi:hypothetical protein